MLLMAPSVSFALKYICYWNISFTQNGKTNSASGTKSVNEGASSFTTAARDEDGNDDKAAAGQ